MQRFPQRDVCLNMLTWTVAGLLLSSQARTSLLELHTGIYEVPISAPVEISAGKLIVSDDDMVGYGVDELTTKQLDSLVTQGKAVHVMGPTIRTIAGKAAEVTTTFGPPTSRQSVSLKLLPRELTRMGFELAVDVHRESGIGRATSTIWHILKRPIVELNSRCLLATTYVEHGVRHRVIVFAYLSQPETAGF